MAQEDTLPSPSRTLDGTGRALNGGSGLDRLARRVVRARLADIGDGRIELIEGTQRSRLGGDSDFTLRASLEVRDTRFWRRALLGGGIGAAEAYADGLWRSDHLTDLLRIMARNLESAGRLEAGLSRLRGLLERLRHRLRGNDRTGSRRNIAAHYDLGNEFFASFLDPTMMYSCAVFPRPDASLEEASRHKLDLVCRKLGLAPGVSVVEIGTGWGGFALHAAGEYGCEVVTTTISRRQEELARRRVLAAGLADRVEVLRLDYRDLPASLGRRFDRLASIEMIEAVGHRFLPRYMQVVSDLLRPDGLALIQAITINDQRYEAYRRSVDLIQRHIFPGGLLPSLGRILESLRDATDLRLSGLEEITPHYARTLRAWRRRFAAATDSLAKLGLPRRFQRLWEYYFCYCEAGFRERVIGDYQLVFAKPRHRERSLAAVEATS
jgi:cyclopropane-fatty-acyl-phospholipid synthase